MWKKIKDCLFCGIFVVVGLLLIVFSRTFTEDDNEFKNKARKTKAYVESTDYNEYRKSYRSNGKTRHRTEREYIAYVTFEANGNKYENVRVVSKRKACEEGKNVTIYYNRESPRQARLELPDPEGTDTMTIFIGIVFILAGALGIRNTIKGEIPHIEIGG